MGGMETTGRMTCGRLGSWEGHPVGCVGYADDMGLSLFDWRGGFPLEPLFHLPPLPGAIPTSLSLSSSALYVGSSSGMLQRWAFPSVASVYGASERGEEEEAAGEEQGSSIHERITLGGMAYDVTPNGSPVNATAETREGSRVCVASAGGAVGVLDVARMEDGVVEEVRVDHEISVMMAGGTDLVYVGGEGGLGGYDLRAGGGGGMVQMFEGAGNVSAGLVLGLLGLGAEHQVGVGTADGFVKVFDVRSPSGGPLLGCEYPRHGGRVGCLAWDGGEVWSASGGVVKSSKATYSIASGGGGGIVDLWYDSAYRSLVGVGGGGVYVLDHSSMSCRVGQAVDEVRLVGRPRERGRRTREAKKGRKGRKGRKKD